MCCSDGNDERNALPSEKMLISKYITNSLSIDGNLKDWQQVNTVELTDRNNLSGNILKIQSAWNAEYLYFGFDVRDSDLRAYQTEKDHKKLYLDDMVEFLLDTRLDRTSEWLEDDIIYHINLLGQKKDDRGTPAGDSDATWDGAARYAVKLNGTLNDTSDIDIGYSVEVAVPWGEIGINPKKNRIFGLNFANGDNDGKGRQLFDWVNAWPTRSPDVFGQLILQ
jgi:hexosaminidase